jgi:outer membrane protein assembly factor BamB
LHTTFAPVVAGPLAIVATKDAIAAVTLADGTSVWTQSLRATVPPIADAACVFVASGADIVRLRLADGNIVARATLPAAATGGLAMAGDAVFVLLEDQTVLRLVASTLATAWRAPIEGIGTSLLAAYDRLYIPLQNGGVAAHAQDNGDFQWMASAGFPITGIAAGHSRVYVAQLDTSLRALRADNGHQAWREVAPRRMAPGLLLIDTRLCAGLVDGAAACWNLSHEGKPPGKPALLPVPDTPDSGPPLAPRLHALAASANGQYVARVLSNFETQWWLTLVRRVDGTPAR